MWRGIPVLLLVGSFCLHKVGGEENGYGYEEQPAEEYPAEETYAEEAQEEAPAAGGGTKQHIEAVE